MAGEEEHAGRTDDSRGAQATEASADAIPAEPIDVDSVSALVDNTEDVGRAAAESAAELTAVKQHSRVSSALRRDSIVAFVAAEVGSFFDVFGRLGVAMVVIFLFSALWTFMLAFIQVYTNDMANAIMNTTQFDNGQFWMLPKPEPGIVWTSVSLLVLFGIGYLGLVVYMLFFRRAAASSHVAAAVEGRKPTNKCARALWWLKQELTTPTPLKRHYFNATLDLPKLIFQTTTLFTYLQRGFPTSLIFFYSVLLFFNWIIACYRYQRLSVDPHLTLSRLFYMFDLFFAVFSPLAVLVYFVYNFDFDRETFQVRQEVLPNGTFDRVARLFGNPAQISGFCSAFHYLQLAESDYIFYKSALNLLSLYKWTKIIHTLIHNYHCRQEATNHPSAAPKCHSGSTDVVNQKIAPKTESGEPKGVAKTQPKVKQGQRDSLTLLVAAVFFVAGVMIFIYSIVAVTSTQSVCHKYTRCSIASYRWNVGSEQCTCLMFVDRTTAPRTFDEWNNPVDTTQHLSELALSGELRIIQIINRALPQLPESVRKCKHLEQIILIYTKTERLPAWINEFSHLEYFHYEGDFTSKRLLGLPDGMFDNFPHLTFIHLGAISKVPAIPSLSNLPQLQYLAIAGGFLLTELPSLEGLSRLSILTLVDIPLVSTLPSFESLKHITSITLRYRIPACCNGFLTGACDLTDFSCSSTPQCMDTRISAADNATLVQYGGKYCPKNSTTSMLTIAPTEYSTDSLCGGVLYKQCEENGKTGMCFNTRMQVVNCVTVPEYQVMRRLEIERGVGPACDPAVEQWLGCSA